MILMELNPAELPPPVGVGGTAGRGCAGANCPVPRPAKRPRIAKPTNAKPNNAVDRRIINMLIYPRIRGLTGEKVGQAFSLTVSLERLTYAIFSGRSKHMKSC